MPNIELVTSVSKNIALPFSDPIIVPKGTTGTLLDIIKEDGIIRFLLEFSEFDGHEWYDLNEVEDKF